MHTSPATVLSWLLAFSPIATVLILMIGFRRGGHQAGPVGWAVAMIVAWSFFGAGKEVLFYSQVRGVWLSLYVLYIIWMALVLYRVVDEAGAIAAIGQGITRLTSEPTMQLLLLAWVFAAFLQGVAGFGVPIAVVAPLLIGLEFTPVVAVAAVAIGHSWSVTFGDMASSFQALMAATNLPGKLLAPWSALSLGVACLGNGIAVAWMYHQETALRRGWPALLLIGATMASIQLGLAVSGLWNLAGFGAGLAGLLMGALVTRLPRYQSRTARVPHAPDKRIELPSPLPLGFALAPYLLLIGVVAAAELWPWLHEELNRVQIQVQVPEVQTRYGWTTDAGPSRAISLFGHAGSLLAYVSVITYFFYQWTGRYPSGAAQRIVRRTLQSAMPASIGIFSMVGMATAMDHSGMIDVLARGLGQVAGPFYPLTAPFIGLLGAFMTGSNTNSNVVFAPLQQQTAILLGINVPVILAAQTTGGSLGSMLAPAKIILGCSTAGLVGREGEVLKKTLPPGLILSGIIGILTLLASR
ncbi:MAG: L-lactate permease [Anaerolineae bacterium]